MHSNQPCQSPQRLNQGRRRPSSLGISLLEMMVTVCILAVLLSQALPALDRMKQRQRLSVLAQTLMTDLKQARNEALLSAEPVRLHFGSAASGSCYIVYTGPAETCKCGANSSAVCTDGAKAIKTQWLPNHQRIDLQANSEEMTITGQLGTVTPGGSIDLRTSQGDSIRQVISIAGRVRTCSPSGSMSQHPVCRS